MANTFSGTSINDTQIMSSCLSALKLHLSPLKVFTLDVGSEPTRKGSTVVVPLVTAGSATTSDRLCCVGMATFEKQHCSDLAARITEP